MRVDRLTKSQLGKKFVEEKKLTIQLQSDLSAANQRIKEYEQRELDLTKEANKHIKNLNQTATQAVQTATRASNAVETFRYTQEQSEGLAGHMATVVGGLTGAYRMASQVNHIKGAVFRNLSELFEPFTMCPRCGKVWRSEERDVLLCETCLKDRTPSTS